MHTKAAIREVFKQKRADFNNKEGASQKIHDLLFSRLMMHRFSPIHVYLPINGEVDTWKIIKTLQSDFAPEIYISKSLPDGELLHCQYLPNTQLNTNQWGISEPADVAMALSSKDFFEKFKSEDILVLMPLLAFDKTGQRLGYGKGYYDRFLACATPNTTKAGLSFFEPTENPIPAQATDIKMDYCITPDRVWTF